MSEDRNVFDPKERRRVAEEMFRAALRPRIYAWVDEVLSDPAVRDRIVQGLFSGGYGLFNSDVLRYEVQDGVLRRAKKLTQDIVDSMGLEVNVRIRGTGSI